MKDTRKVFDNTTIPHEWEVSTVGKAFNICNNLRLPISEEERSKIQGEYPYYGPTKIQDYINYYRVDGKYALIGEDGDHFLKWRELPMTLLVEGKFNVNNHAHIIQGDKNLTEWFFYFFNNRELTPHLTRQGAGRYKLTKDALSKMPIPVPPLPEQKAIAHVLGLIDSAINTNNQLIAQKELRKKWLMQNLLTGKKRLKGFSGEWKEIQLDKVADVRDGTHESPEYYQEGVKFITSKNIKDGALDFSNVSYISEGDALDYNKRSKVNKGDILMSMIGTIGNSVLVDFEPDFCIKNVGLIKPVQINGIYLIQYFHSTVFQNYLLGKLDGGIQKFISLSGLRELKILVPSSEEQTAIAQLLQTADKEIQLLKTKTEKLRQQKKGMMQVLLTGKKRLMIKK